jgi:pimeloyl-ACP methyl ester carboxylesterase
VRGRGEFFIRDSGGDGPPVLLLHGWMFASDLNWFRIYDPLIDAGYRVLALDHRGHGRGLRNWTEPYMRRLWRTMGGLRLALNLFPTAAWQKSLKLAGFPASQTTTWIASELSRGSSRDMAEAGRELGRFDSRPWLRGVDVPAAVVVTSKDRSVPPRKQRELVQLLGAKEFEHPGDHSAVVVRGRQYAAVLVEALAAVREAPARVA